MLTFSESYFQTIPHISFRVNITQHIFKEVLENSIIHFPRVYIKKCWHLQYYQSLSNETDIFRELPPNTDFFCLSHSQILTCFKSLLTRISARSTFKTVFHFKMLNILWDRKYTKYAIEIFIIFCYEYKHLPFSNMPYQPEINFTDNK